VVWEWDVFHPKFGVALLVSGIGAQWSGNHKLIIRVITIQVILHIQARYINVTDRQTDGRTTY